MPQTGADVHSSTYWPSPEQPPPQGDIKDTRQTCLYQRPAPLLHSPKGRMQLRCEAHVCCMQRAAAQAANRIRTTSEPLEGTTVLITSSTTVGDVGGAVRNVTVSIELDWRWRSMHTHQAACPAASNACTTHERVWHFVD